MKLANPLALTMLLALIASCEQAPPEVNQAESPQAAEVLPKADPIASYFLWTPEEQLIGYRNIDKIFATRHVPAGGSASEMARADDELQVSFSYNDEQLDIDSFMERNNVVGALVIKDDEIVLERYREDYDDSQRWISFSMAKSLSTTLVGAAIKDGYIQGLQDPLTDYLPELAGSAYDDITIEQLLTMTTGTAWNEDYSDPLSDVAKIKVEPSTNGSDPVVSYMSRLQREVEPGTRFQYNTGETHLIGSLLYAATDKYLADYLAEKIWIPVGMELDSSWMLASGGIEQAGCCLSISLRDFGRFALFFMNDAVIDGESILPEGWLSQATTPTDVSKGHPMFQEAHMNGYGYMWWTLPGNAFEALGIFGQQLHINPESNLVVVLQAAWPTALGSELENRAGAFVAAIEAATAK